ncbi:MAG: hypothetical protein ACFUZC_08500 [Chthoniobacteraceae bacterium]
MNSLPALLCLVVSVAWIGTPSANAQQPPTGPTPLVHTPPDGSCWTVEIQYQGTPHHNEAAGPSRSPGSFPAHTNSVPTRVEKLIGKNHIQQTTITYADNHSSRFYLSDDYILQKYDHSEKIAVFPAETSDPKNGIFDTLRGKSFPGIDWLTLKNYEGVEIVKQQACYKFHIPGNTNTDKPGLELQAWIRIVDHYPQQIQIGNTHYLFSEVTPYSQNIQLSAAYQDALSHIQSEMRAIGALNQNQANHK